MGLLDFIKNRQSQQQLQEPSAQPKPETAREMYTQQASRDAATQKPVEQMPEAERTRAAELGARLDKATQHVRQDGAGQAPAPADATASPQPMRQNMMSQDQAAPDLSPTSAQRGQTANEKSTSAPSQESQSQDRAKTSPSMQQGRGGWER